MRAAIDGVHAGQLVHRALADPGVIASLTQADRLDVLAAGKAAGVMLRACADAVEGGRAQETPRSSSRPHPRLRRMLGIGLARPSDLPSGAEWITGGHPLPTDGSMAGGRAARDLARHAGEHDLLLVLLSGGGSALMALPADGITLAEKQQTVRLLMDHGADIYELNTVRKHLSAIKGGQLTAASRGAVLTLAVSDVVGDDLSVIASGPTVPDHSTFAQALAILERRGGTGIYPAAVVTRLEGGRDGRIAETPHESDARMQRSRALVIGPQRGAINDARRMAAALGFHVHVIDQPVTGEARLAAAEHVRNVSGVVRALPRPLCVIASGETTVTVTGRGVGGRNQEFAFAMARLLDRLQGEVVAASVGTDGIDGPTDAAGAIVDRGTFTRAAAAGLRDFDSYLTDNNTYVFFDRIGDLIRTGPTSTNVGDLQVILIA